jgi:hypothetical protein
MNELHRVYKRNRTEQSYQDIEIEDMDLDTPALSSEVMEEELDFDEKIRALEVRNR